MCPDTPAPCFNLTRPGLLSSCHSDPAFRAKRSTASLPESELRRNAAVTREATLLATKSSGDPELDLALREATQKEVDRGWLRGPVNPRSLDPEAVISRRFGIWQGDKCRPIDDFRASGVNATTSAEDSVTVHSADTIAASIAYRLKVEINAGGMGAPR